MHAQPPILPIAALILMSACHAGDGGQKVAVAPLAQASEPSESRSVAASPLAQAPEFSETRTVLAVPHIQQETLLCVPTAAAMVLAFYGDQQPPRRLKVLASGGSYDPNAPFSDYSITLYRDIVRAVQTLGYSWVERSYPNTDSGFTDGIALIESEIRNGRPVLADVTAPEGHTFVVSGFDTIARKLLVTDPNRPAPGQRWLGYEKFQAIWNERAYGGDFRSLVTTQAKTGP